MRYFIQYLLYKRFANLHWFLLGWFVCFLLTGVLYLTGSLVPNNFTDDTFVLLLNVSALAWGIVAVIGFIVRTFHEESWGWILEVVVPIFFGWAVWRVTDFVLSSMSHTSDWVTFHSGFLPGFLSYVCVVIYIIAVEKSTPPRLREVFVVEFDRTFTDPLKMHQAVKHEKVTFLGPLRITINSFEATFGLGAEYKEHPGGCYWEYFGETFGVTRHW